METSTIHEFVYIMKDCFYLMHLFLLQLFFFIILVKDQSLEENETKEVNNTSTFTKSIESSKLKIFYFF